jgi:large subunit ribosomal protein L24
MKLKIKKGDLVRVISGNDKNGTPKRVLQVYAEKMRVLVEGVNVRKKHSKPTQNNPKGGIVSKEMPVHYSNVLLVDSSKNPTRVGVRYEKKGDLTVAVRYAKTDNKEISQ